MCLSVSGGKGRIRSSAQRPLRFLARALVLLVFLPAIAMEEALDLAPLPQRSRRAFGTAAPPGTDAAGPPRAHARAEPAMVPPAAPVDIDGSMLEGGGQIIRVCSALSALLGTPIRLQKIRAGRPKGGLAAQHAAGLKLVSEMCGAALEGASIGSSTVTLRPGPLAQGGRFGADAETAGATMLMLQSALPCCCVTGAGGGLTQLSLRGGTNVPFSPQLEYMQHITLPAIHRLLGVRATMNLQKRGCFPRGGGEVAVDIEPLPGSLPSFEMLERGRVAEIGGRVWSTGSLAHETLRSELVCECTAAIAALPELSTVPVTIEVSSCGRGDEIPGGSSGCGVVLWAKTSSGCVLGGSAMLDKKSANAGAARQVAVAASQSLGAELRHGGCVDQHLQDQMIVFMSLAKGTSRFRSGPLTLHTETAMYMCGLLTGATFAVEKTGPGPAVVIECRGIGFTRA